MNDLIGIALDIYRTSPPPILKKPLKIDSGFIASCFLTLIPVDAQTKAERAFPPVMQETAGICAQGYMVPLTANILYG